MVSIGSKAVRAVGANNMVGISNTRTPLLALSTLICYGIKVTHSYWHWAKLLIKLRQTASKLMFQTNVLLLVCGTTSHLKPIFYFSLRHITNKVPSLLILCMSTYTQSIHTHYTQGWNLIGKQEYKPILLLMDQSPAAWCAFSSDGGSLCLSAAMGSSNGHLCLIL